MAHLAWMALTKFNFAVSDSPVIPDNCCFLHFFSFHFVIFNCVYMFMLGSRNVIIRFFVMNDRNKNKMYLCEYLILGNIIEYDMNL